MLERYVPGSTRSEAQHSPELEDYADNEGLKEAEKQSTKDAVRFFLDALLR